MSAGAICDLYGTDGRRIVRSHSYEACEELAARIRSKTGERCRVVVRAPALPKPGKKPKKRAVHRFDHPLRGLRSRVF